VSFIANVSNSIFEIVIFDAVGKEINIPIDNNELDVHILKSRLYFIKILEKSAFTLEVVGILFN